MPLSRGRTQPTLSLVHTGRHTSAVYMRAPRLVSCARSRLELLELLLDQHRPRRIGALANGDGGNLDLALLDLIVAPEDEGDGLGLEVGRTVRARRRVVEVILVEVLRVPLVNLVLTRAARTIRERSFVSGRRARTRKKGQRAWRCSGLPRTSRAARSRCPAALSNRHC